ncbi:unnamed protein product [Rotaria magnacalcarata]
MISIITHSLKREMIERNDDSLYTAMRSANDTMLTMDNQRLRSLVASEVGHKNKSTDLAFQRDKCGETIRKCPNTKTIQGELQDRESKLDILAKLCRFLIYVVVIKPSVQGNIIHVLNYGAFAVPYSKYDGDIYSDCNNKSFINQSTAGLNVSNDGDRLLDLFTSGANEKDSNKRKELDYGSLAFAKTTEKLSVVLNKRQKDIPIRESIAVEQGPEMCNHTTESSSQSSKNVPNASNNEEENEKMRFKNQPERMIRGRYASEVEPTKPFKRNGQPSEPGPPRYFADEQNNNYLSLLIPNSYIPGDISRYRLEICLATREIDGYRYIHPYFKFRVQPTGRNPLMLNPIYIYFNDELKLEKISESSRQLPLQFMIVMHTNKELMKSEQPLTIFSSSTDNNHRRMIRTKFDNQKALKDAYHLNELVFAVTLWSKKPGENEFHRHADKQYISRISEQNRDAKVSNKDTKERIAIYEYLCNFIYEQIGN